MILLPSLSFCDESERVRDKTFSWTFLVSGVFSIAKGVR